MVNRHVPSDSAPQHTVVLSKDLADWRNFRPQETREILKFWKEKRVTVSFGIGTTEYKYQEIEEALDSKTELEQKLERVMLEMIVRNRARDPDFKG